MTPAPGPEDHDDPIEEVAANWLTLRSEGLSSSQRREFERWRQADPHHAAAVARLEAACDLLEKMPRVRADLQPVITFPSPARPVERAAGRSGRGWLTAAAVAAAVIITAVAFRPWRLASPASHSHATSAGGYERVVLGDGSVIELNASTEVRVVLAADERRVSLLSGEAHFTVAHDPGRPFVVEAAGFSVRAVGTAFNVLIGSEAVEVLVTEGKVAVVDRPADTARPPPPSGRSPGESARRGFSAFLEANERARIPAPMVPDAVPPEHAAVIEKVTPEAVRRALSWQERRLVFAETPLREVATEFNRRNRIQIVLGDDRIGARPVGGAFAADNVEGFLRLLESSGRITVERRDEKTVVLRAAD
jgi:transmembrane sensor